MISDFGRFRSQILRGTRGIRTILSNKCFPKTEIDKCLCMSFLCYRKVIQRHLSISVAGKQFRQEWVPDSLVPSLRIWELKRPKWENTVRGSKKSQINQYKPFLDRKAYVLESNAQKFLERVLDFSLTSTPLRLHSAETERSSVCRSRRMSLYELYMPIERSTFIDFRRRETVPPRVETVLGPREIDRRTTLGSLGNRWMFVFKGSTIVRLLYQVLSWCWLQT